MKLWHYKLVCLFFVACVGASVYAYVSFAGGDPEPSPDPDPGISADVVLGQTTFTGTGNTVSVSGAFLSSPASVYVGGGKTYVADSINNRVLIWNTSTPVDGQEADIVLGQADLSSTNSNRGGSVAANTLNAPSSVFSDGTRIFVSDQNNYRVLIWNTTTPANGQDADVVLGQTDFVSANPNQGGSANSSTLYSAIGVFSSGSKIYVADQANARVLIWNTVTPTNGQGADVVLGQADFDSAQSNRGGGASSSTLSNPAGVVADGSRIFVTDQGNHRVLIWNTVTPTNGQGADVVLGQADFDSAQSNRGGGATMGTLSTPIGISVDSSRIFVAEAGNHRALIWNTLTPTNGQDADVVLGQASAVSAGANRGGNASSSTLSGPWGVFSDNSNIYIADTSNNRVLSWNTVTPTDGQGADGVLGQGDFFTTVVAHPGAATQYDPRGIFVDDSYVYVADSSNNRVLLYDNSGGLTTGQDAVFVLGQVAFSGNTSGTGASRLNTPKGVMKEGGNVYVADTYNHRVLIWTSPIVSNAQEADIVLGQDDFDSVAANKGGGISTSSLYEPTGVYSDGSKLYVADSANHRVLIWNTTTPATGSDADIVLGQANFLVGSANRGGSAGTSTLYNPAYVYSDGSKIYVADRSNRRALIWNTTSPENGADADVVLGQADFVSGETGPNVTTTAYTEGIVAYGGFIFVTDYSNNRVMIWNTTNPVSGQAADSIIGSGNFTSAGGYDTSSTTLGAPSGLAVVDGYIFVADGNRHRTLRFPFEVSGATAPDAPTSLSVTSINTSSIGSITWTDNATDETGYIVDVAAGSDGSVFPSVNESVGNTANATSSNWVGLEPNTQYILRVAAYNGTGTSTYATSSAFYTLSTVPTSLSATVASATGINLTWSGDGTSYILSNDTLATTSSVAGTSSSVTGLTCNTSYTFSVKAVNGDGVETSYSSSTSATTSACPSSGGGGGGFLFAKKQSDKPAVDPVSMNINNNKRVTRSRLVRVLFGSSLNATQVALSESPNFTDAMYKPFRTLMRFRLSKGAGEKTIYASVRTDNVATTTLSDTIVYTPRTITTLQTTPSFVFTLFLSRGSSGPEVLELQKKLQSLGFLPSTITPNGVFGPATQEAVVAFQRANGIDPFGYVGPATRAVLNK